MCMHGVINKTNKKKEEKGKLIPEYTEYKSLMI